jgi:uncharacterized protein
MTSARDEAQRLLWRARRRLDDLFPGDCLLIDAHTHLGQDEDGMALELETLLAQMDAFGVAEAIVFALHESDRHPAYQAPNDRVLAAAGQADGRLVPFCRLDLAEEPLREAERCIAAGARGIKLHPRAQRFTVDDSRLEPVFALAEAHHLPVLIHAGRGMPPIGEHLARVAEHHPGAILILAHAAIVDQDRICELVAGRANVLFDTSTWMVVDILNLFARVAPEQVVWATDTPYGNHLYAQWLVGCVLDQLGADERIRRAVFGETIRGVLRGELPRLTDPIAPATWTLTHSRLRVFAYLAAVTPLIWLRQPDAIGLAGLAASACLDQDEELASVGELVRASTALWEDLGLDAGRTELQDVQRLIGLAQLACLLPDAAKRTFLCG